MSGSSNKVGASAQQEFNDRFDAIDWAGASDGVATPTMMAMVDRVEAEGKVIDLMEELNKSLSKPNDLIPPPTVVRFTRIGPWAFDNWLRPELPAGVVTYDGDESSGSITLRYAEDEQLARTIILQWCDLVD